MTVVGASKGSASGVAQRRGRGGARGSVPGAVRAKARPFGCCTVGRMRGVRVHRACVRACTMVVTRRSSAWSGVAWMNARTWWSTAAQQAGRGMRLGPEQGIEIQGGGGTLRRRGEQASCVTMGARERRLVAACKVFGRMPRGTCGCTAVSEASFVRATVPGRRSR